MTKNNRTNFEGINEDNAEKARITSETVNLEYEPNPPHHIHGRFETEQQKEQFEANELKDDERIIELYDDEDL